MLTVLKCVVQSVCSSTGQRNRLLFVLECTVLISEWSLSKILNNTLAGAALTCFRLRQYWLGWGHVFWWRVQHPCGSCCLRQEWTITHALSCLLGDMQGGDPCIIQPSALQFIISMNVLYLSYMFYWAVHRSILFTIKAACVSVFVLISRFCWGAVCCLLFRMIDTFYNHSLVVLTFFDPLQFNLASSTSCDHLHKSWQMTHLKERKK